MFPLISINGGPAVSPSESSAESAASNASGQAVQQPAMVSALDRGFTLGDGLFETLRIERGEIWYLDRHLSRLCHGAERLGIEYPAGIKRWATALASQASELPVSPGVMGLSLRITLTRGVPSSFDLTGESATSPTTTLVVSEIPPLAPPDLYDRGLSATIAAAPRNERAVTAGLKTTNYLETIVAVRAARHAGYHDVIFLDTHGFVAEASTSNIFIVLNDTLVTPSLTHGILPGITRAVVCELAENTHMALGEREVRLEEMLNADEAFLTSSLRGIVPLVRVGHDIIGTGAPGPMTHHVLRAYEGLTSRV